MISPPVYFSPWWKPAGHQCNQKPEFSPGKYSRNIWHHLTRATHLLPRVDNDASATNGVLILFEVQIGCLHSIATGLITFVERHIPATSLRLNIDHFPSATQLPSTLKRLPMAATRVDVTPFPDFTPATHLGFWVVGFRPTTGDVPVDFVERRSRAAADVVARVGPVVGAAVALQNSSDTRKQCEQNHQRERLQFHCKIIVFFSDIS